MKVYNNFKSTDSVKSEPLVTSIGGFDGIHLGHQALFKKAFDVSNAMFQIVTFNEIPKIYFNNDLKPLIDQDQRSSIFEKLLPKNIIFLDFKSVNKMNAQEFCQFLQHNLQTEKLVIGKDFRFGNQRVGDVNTLINYFGEENVTLLDDYLISSEKVSTTKIRLFYAQGKIKEAEKYLGRPISYTGTVVLGKQLGSSIGFPTANVQLHNLTQLPRFGVYAVRVHIDKKTYLGCLNIGINPTVEANLETKIEIHILEFDENIYDKNISFELIEFIRDEKKFGSIDDLTAQIQLDVDKIKNNF
ncbi:riboflavin biosynthesis protein RibF [Candidatus Actinomarina sp.]|jgi:riboflavin kinase/FMN adenylyltransferase|nr:riboflavin biosynthesis protein RibF [Acidimicrobiaceae bacterium]MDA8710193.1 riboflavin biosynthesis protein RibF [Candidatus Actinomarina sp.]MDA9173496.1 riboflavin biosynthesis protein RibF [Acidimicrobiia bacterium]MDA9209666.1 riboflavin biosynthesis protein RibF [Acidimicrobiia bacterium]MDB4833408.1 riboflavin biosynthesis protein RibF [Acidimicrobiia bacterium]